jgi:hypothetical protein
MKYWGCSPEMTIGNGISCRKCTKSHFLLFSRRWDRGVRERRYFGVGKKIIRTDVNNGVLELEIEEEVYFHAPNGPWTSANPAADGQTVIFEVQSRGVRWD